MLPAELSIALEQELARFPTRALQLAAEELSAWYRAGGPGAKATAQDTLRWREEHYTAYALTRMPATYAAVGVVLAESALRVKGFAPKTHLDLCSGPGTALWAARGMFSSIRESVALEQDEGMIRLARRLATVADAHTHNSEATLDHSQPFPLNLRYIHGDASRYGSPDQHELVTICYGLNELSPGKRQEAIAHAWQAASGMLVIVEPGSMAGYEVILQARQYLIQQDAHIVAPCPNRLPCPLAGSVKWCHFSRRLSRSREHRILKHAELGYEDEKYSYVAAARLPVMPAHARIIGYPRTSKPGIELDLCAHGEARTVMVRKSDKEAYRMAKRANWGDAWDNPVAQQTSPDLQIAIDEASSP